MIIFFCSSRFTASSNSSNSNSCPYPVSDELPELNPFLPDMVNRMLNAVGGVPQHIVHYTANTLPSIGVSSKLNLSGESFFLTSLLAEGSFSRTYSTATSAVLQAMMPFYELSQFFIIAMLFVDS